MTRKKEGAEGLCVRKKTRDRTFGTPRGSVRRARRGGLDARNGRSHSLVHEWAELRSVVVWL